MHTHTHTGTCIHMYANSRTCTAHTQAICFNTFAFSSDNLFTKHDSVCFYICAKLIRKCCSLFYQFTTLLGYGLRCFLFFVSLRKSSPAKFAHWLNFIFHRNSDLTLLLYKNLWIYNSDMNVFLQEVVTLWRLYCLVRHRVLVHLTRLKHHVKNMDSSIAKYWCHLLRFWSLIIASLDLSGSYQTDLMIVVIAASCLCIIMVIAGFAFLWDEQKHCQQADVIRR